MKISAVALVAALAVFTASPAPAQRQKISINAETPEGKLLQQIGQEADEAKKAALMEQFVATYPAHDGAGWVYEQLVPAYAKQGAHDKVIAAGEKLLALDPDDSANAVLILKAAEAKQDAAGVVKWSDYASKIARKLLAEPKPADAEELKTWTAQQEYAKQVDVYTEYALFNQTLLAKDPAAIANLIEILEKRNPQSQYVAQAYSPYFVALQRSGNIEKAVAVAENALQKDPSNEEMLMVVADYYMTKKPDPAKTLLYSNKLVEAMGTKQKPPAVSDADWDKRRNVMMGAGHLMAGVTQVGQNKFADGDKSLRAALPYVKDNPGMHSTVLFHLGLANFKLGDVKPPQRQRILDAIQFNQECAAIPGPYQATARKNVTAIKTQYKIR